VGVLEQLPHAVWRACQPCWQGKTKGQDCAGSGRYQRLILLQT